MPSVHLPPWIARQAAELLARPGHAWLLQGPSGLGQFELALALAAAWLCDAPTPQGACGQCPGCHSLHVHAHADFVCGSSCTSARRGGSEAMNPPRRHWSSIESSY